MNSMERLLMEEEGRQLGILRGPTLMLGGGKIQRDALSLRGEVEIEEARVVDNFLTESTEGQLVQVLIHTEWQELSQPHQGKLQVTKLPIKR